MEIKNPAFQAVIFLVTVVMLLFTCSSDGDKRKTIRKQYGEPDFIQKSEYAGLKSEFHVYARKDINRVYEFRKTVSGCGGSGEWYLFRIYYADALGYVLYMPPLIKHTPIQSAPPGSAIPVSAEVTDDEQVAYVTLHYRMTGQEEFFEVSMSDKENIYSINIPAEAVTAVGVEYFIEANDGVYTSQIPEEGYYQITVSTAEKTITVAPSETSSREISPSLIPQPGDVNCKTSPLSP